MSFLPPRILVVEDDDPIRALLVTALRRRAPVVIDTARDGVDAVEELLRNDYAVVVIDLMMPRMNGYELIERIGAMALPGRPVLFVMTAFDVHSPDLNCRLVHGIIRKPFDLDTVVDLIIDCAMNHHGGGVSDSERPIRPEAVC